MKVPGLSKRSSHLAIAAPAAMLVTLLHGVASAQSNPPQSVTQCTLSNGVVNGPFGGYNISGSFSGPTGAVPTQSTIIASGAYVYTFTGPLNGSGYTLPSQLPVTPCVLAGCPPPTPLYADLHVAPNDTNTSAALQFTDAGEPFDGIGTLSCTTTGAPPPPSCPAGDAAARRARPDASGANGSLTVTCGCNVQINVALIGNGTQQIYASATPVGMKLDAAAKACSYSAFNWQQLVTNLPCPSPGFMPNTRAFSPRRITVVLQHRVPLPPAGTPLRSAILRRVGM
jgi:hypothetical protein